MAEAAFGVELHGLTIVDGIFFPVRNEFIIGVARRREGRPRRLNNLDKFLIRRKFFGRHVEGVQKVESVARTQMFERSLFTEQIKVNVSKLRLIFCRQLLTDAPIDLIHKIRKVVFGVGAAVEPLFINFLRRLRFVSSEDGRNFLGGSAEDFKEIFVAQKERAPLVGRRARQKFNAASCAVL